MIRAAGAAVWRPSPSGTGVEFVVVHRERYDDWSFPKGRAEPGETPEQTALREVHEETGLTCELGAELPPAAYPVAGQPKTVRYWCARATGGAFIPNEEVDEIRWLTPQHARDLLTHAHDRRLVAAALRALDGG